jgi:Peptidase family M48
VPRSLVDAFVYPSPELQASCLSVGPDSCIVRLSSALVELLDAEEIGFVVGHELGHFLLRHGSATAGVDEESPELLMFRRSQEISADRVGLLAIDSIEVAARALMKTASGLGDRHLRFDVGTFLAQLGSVQAGSGHQFSTHPSILVRCRALLWISTEDLEGVADGKVAGGALDKIEDLIDADLDRYIDGVVRARICDAQLDLTVWSIAYEVTQAGGFTKAAQDWVEDVAGADQLNRLIDFLSETVAETAEDEVYERLSAARAHLEDLAPITFGEEVSKIERLVADNLSSIRGASLE